MIETENGARIELLFCEGHPLEHVVDFGETLGWTREDVLEVLREREWNLDASGRLPRGKRVTTPRGLRGLPSVPTVTPPPARERWLPPLDDPRLPTMTGSITISGDTIARATEIRERVDAMAPRANEFGGVNTQHVAMEQTLRERAGLPAYIGELDGPGNFLPTPELADWEKALVADPFDPEHPALQVPDGFVPGEPLSAPPPSPEPVPAPEPPADPVEPAAPATADACPLDERPRMPCTVRPVLEPREPVDPTYDHLRARAKTSVGDVGRAKAPPGEPLQVAGYRPPAPLSHRGRRPDGRDLDEWLDDACRDDRPHVRRAAERACLLHEQLHDALDELVRAEHNQRGAR